MTDRPIFYIDGSVDAGVRNDMRAQIEDTQDGIIIASLKTTSTGINIKRLNNIFFTHPSKSRITTLQSIGRVLRKAENKNTAKLFDIADDLSIETTRKKKHFNYVLRHFLERIKIYQSENFKYKVSQVEL
jgi:predicted helicase